MKSLSSLWTKLQKLQKKNQKLDFKKTSKKYFGLDFKKELLLGTSKLLKRDRNKYNLSRVHTQ